MKNNQYTKINLDLLVPTILLDAQPDFKNPSDHLEEIHYHKDNFKNLFDVYLALKKQVLFIKEELENFISSGGCLEGNVFPYHPHYYKTFFELFSLFNNSDETLLEKHFSLVEHSSDAEYYLVFSKGKLSLSKINKNGKLEKNPVCVDFLEGKAAFRVKSNVKSEAVVKACLKKNIPADQQFILDATGGFGQDSILLAKTGAKVTILERNPIISLLLADGLRRLKSQEEINVNLIFPASITWEETQKQLNKYNYHTLYLDPMYPHTSKTAKVNKNMQVIQKVVGSDEDSDSLLSAANLINTQTVVVKRPKNAPFLNNQETKDNLSTASHRFDYYLLNNANLLKTRDFVSNLKPLIYEELVDNNELKRLSTPSLDALTKCRRTLHFFNNQYHFNENSKFFDAYCGFSPYLNDETILKRVISRELHECAMNIYHGSPNHQDYTKDLKGTKLARLISFTMKEDSRDKYIRIIQEKFPEAIDNRALELELYCEGIRKTMFLKE